MVASELGDQSRIVSANRRTGPRAGRHPIADGCSVEVRACLDRGQLWEVDCLWADGDRIGPEESHGTGRAPFSIYGRGVEFVIARNPDPASSLPFLVRLPVGSRAVVLKVKDTWPRTAKVFCHPATEWPDVDDLEIVERVPVTSCVRRGVAIDLVLDRARENRSQFIFTTARGREVVFWQSARTRKQARPNVAIPTARASGRQLDIIVDTRERYAWKFSTQQATTVRRALPVGDYAVEIDGQVVAAVERKSIEDLVSTVVGGKLWTLLAAMADVPHAALVVDDRYSSLFKLTHVRPTTIAEQIAEAAVRYPTVSIVFAETRQLAQEWTYRFFGAAIEHRANEASGTARLDALPTAGPIPQRDVAG
jgi:hypothetical protein